MDNALWTFTVECDDGADRTVHVLAPGYATAHQLIYDHPVAVGLDQQVLAIKPDWMALGEVRP